MTRSLNIIISRLAFHEMRVRVNAGFTEQILKCILDIEHAIGNQSEQKQERLETLRETRQNKLKSASRSLRERLAHFKTENQALLLEIACNQKIAQSQLEIVSLCQL
jgi:hypothetical protein